VTHPCRRLLPRLEISAFGIKDKAVQIEENSGKGLGFTVHGFGF
jgi:hypothetical protein